MTLLALALYAHTLAPTVTLEDSGEMVVAADFLGVPHPPGYPVWTVTSWFFRWAFQWVEYFGRPDSNAALVWKSLLGALGLGPRGAPNPAWGVGLASAVFGALACGLLSLLLCRSGRDLLAGALRPAGGLSSASARSFCWAGAVSAGCILACSPVLWSQSVIAEVYSLNAFFQAWLLVLLYRWARRPSEAGPLLAAGFLFGLGLANHQTLAFMGPMFAGVVLLTDPRRFRAFALAGLGLLALVLFQAWSARRGWTALLWAQGPGSAAFWAVTGLALAVPLIALAAGGNGRWAGGVLLLFALGLSFYLYLPIASEQNPPMNWGYPRTWAGFLHVLTRGQYDRIEPANMFSGRFLVQLGLYAKDVRSQFSMPIVLGGFLPFCAWRLRWGNRRIPAFLAALLVALAAVPLIIVEAPFQAKGWAAWAAAARKGYVLLSALVLLAGAVGALVVGLKTLDGLLCRLRAPATDRSTRALYALLAGLLALLALAAGGMTLWACFRHPGWTSSLGGILAVGLPVPAAIALWRLAVRGDRITTDLPPRAGRWLLLVGVAFFSVSFVFLAVANDALDLSTQFVIRVQLIQSHALFVVWLGYGLILAPACLQAAAGLSRAARAGILAVVLALPGVLLWQNAHDEEQLRVLGGAEQNRRDFGWIFGHWSLQGVEAIRRELPPGEWAEYPTPDYPPPMEPDAIFFGGTDPGRFVPTYMIYSAGVRGDVHLLTQNALADGTYMSVMRDLYGDRIWIPSSLDMHRAFDRFAREVRAGRADAGSDVVVENGRISVQGLQGVMQINGILSRWIFERNRARHAFYVEESYLIPWMVPYLQPHGIILKLHPEPVEWTGEMIRNDRLFWNWLAGRLLENPRFLRDVVARKTFSKLRSAGAGLYAERGLYAESEAAFRQAIALHPLSQEAHFRLADVLLRQHRIEDALLCIRAFLEQDPLHERGIEMGKALSGLLAADRRREQLEARLSAGEPDPAVLVELLPLYRMLQMWPSHDRAAEFLLSIPGLDPRVIAEIVQASAERARWLDAERALHRLLAVPGVPDAIWADLVFVLMLQNRPEALWDAVDKGLAATRGALREMLLMDPRFLPIRSHPEFERRLAPSHPPSQPAIPDRLRSLIR